METIEISLYRARIMLDEVGLKNVYSFDKAGVEDFMNHFHLFLKPAEYVNYPIEYSQLAEHTRQGGKIRVVTEEDYFMEVREHKREEEGEEEGGHGFFDDKRISRWQRNRGRAYWAGYYIGMYGIPDRITQKDIDMVTRLYGIRNDKQSIWALDWARRFINGYLHGLKDKKEKENEDAGES